MNNTWAGVAVGAIAVIPAYVGIGAAWVRAGVADGRAERAEERAEGALEAYQRMADSLDRLASGQNRVTGADVEGPLVSFAVEWRGKNLYTLRNLGPETATEVTVTDEGLPVIADVPQRATLRPLEAYEMFLIATMGQGIPAQLIVTCAELNEPVVVPVPEKF